MAKGAVDAVGRRDDAPRGYGFIEKQTLAGTPDGGIGNVIARKNHGGTTAGCGLGARV